VEAMTGASQEAGFASGLRLELGLPGTLAMHGLELQDETTHATDACLPERLRGASPKRRREFIAGRLCASIALSGAGYGGPAWLAQDSDGLPVWPKGWTGCISHSTSMVLAAACPTSTRRSLGLDIEELGTPRHAAEIASSVGQPRELALLGDWPSAVAVILLFSAKESLYKALFPRLRVFREFSAARLVAVSAGRLRLRLEEDWGTGWPAGRVVEVRHACRHNHVITACCPAWADTGA